MGEVKIVFEKMKGGARRNGRRWREQKPPSPYYKQLHWRRGGYRSSIGEVKIIIEKMKG